MKIDKIYVISLNATDPKVQEDIQRRLGDCQFEDKQVMKLSKPMMVERVRSLKIIHHTLVGILEKILGTSGGREMYYQERLVVQFPIELFGKRSLWKVLKMYLS